MAKRLHSLIKNNSNKNNSIKKTTQLFIGIGSVFILAACQSTPTAPVIKRANSTYETTGLGSSKVAAQHAAINSANSTCGLKEPIVITDNTVYNGVFGEQAGRAIEQMGSIAGSVLGTGSPDLTRDDDYEYTITFRCE